MLKNAALAYPGKEVTDATNGIRRTYKELDERVNRIASGFLERGYKPGDFIALLAGWRIETIEVCFACARTGTIFIRQIPRQAAHVLARNYQRILPKPGGYRKSLALRLFRFGRRSGD
ncbi:MAG: AMP-binding protein [Desulfotomaculales bacterium]